MNDLFERYEREAYPELTPRVAPLQDAYERLGHTDISITRGIYDRNIRRVSAL